MCGREVEAGRERLVDDPPATGQAAHAGQVDPHHVHGLGLDERLGEVAAALLVAHRDGHVDAIPELAQDARVTGREDVLEPAEAARPGWTR